MAGVLLFSIPAEIRAEDIPAMFIIMTVYTEIFPIGSIRGVIVVVSVLMVDSKQVLIFDFKLPTTFSADGSMDFKRSFPVITR